ncbi:MAG: hypothetical protein U1E42_00700 [Rhodospirillales bacterium]
MRWVIPVMVLVALMDHPRPSAAQQPSQGAAAAPIPLSQLLASGFEIKGAVLAGILVQRGPLAYICTTAQRERPVDWSCFPLHR